MIVSALLLFVGQNAMMVCSFCMRFVMRIKYLISIVLLIVWESSLDIMYKAKIQQYALQTDQMESKYLQKNAMTVTW